MRENDPANRRLLTLFLLSLSGGGAEKAMLLLARHFRSRGFDVDVVCAGVGGSEDGWISSGVRVVRFGHRHVFRRSASVIRGLRKYIEREQPLAILSGLNLANVLALFAKRASSVGVRVVTSEHTPISWGIRNGPIASRCVLPLLTRKTYPSADGIVAVSSGVADDLARFVRLPRIRIDVIHNPFDFTELALMARKPAEHRWLTPGGPPVVLAAGRLTPAKDFLTLIEGFALVRRACDARLIVLGEGEQRPDIEERVRELELEKVVDLPGFVDNPFACMAGAAVFVLSSRWEGFGNVLVEAMACGCRVVSTDCFSGPREILEGGRYGTLVRVGDAKALAEAIVASLLKEGRGQVPVERLRSFALQRVGEQYLRVMQAPSASALQTR